MEKKIHENGVVELDPADPRATRCGHCGRGWDDDVVTSLTPAPSARCPFEYDHKYPPTRRVTAQPTVTVCVVDGKVAGIDIDWLGAIPMGDDEPDDEAGQIAAAYLDDPVIRARVLHAIN